VNLLKNIEKTIQCKWVLSMLRMGQWEKTNSAVTSSKDIAGMFLGINSAVEKYLVQRYIKLE